MKIVRVPEAFDIDDRVSKYCVMSSSDMTVSADIVPRFSRTMSADSDRPSAIALRCLAMPMPCRCFDSASASAPFTWRIFSASASISAATLRRSAALMRFIEVLDCLIGVDVGHQRLDDEVAKVVHDVGQLLLDSLGDIVLGLERLIEGEARHPGPDHVVDVALDLAPGIRKLVVGIICVLDLKLHGDGHLHEHVVLRLRLAAHDQLLDPEIETDHDGVDERHHEIETSRRDEGVLAEALDDRDGLLLHGEDGHGILRMVTGPYANSATILLAVNISSLYTCV